MGGSYTYPVPRFLLGLQLESHEKEKANSLLPGNQDITPEICLRSKCLTTCVMLVFWKLLLGLKEASITDRPNAAPIWCLGIKSHTPRQVERQPV